MSVMDGVYKFFSNNVKGIKASEKRVKLFEYLKNNITIMALYFYRKHIRRQKTNKNGKTVLRVLYFFRMETEFLGCGNLLLWNGSF